MIACNGSGFQNTDHFVDANKMVEAYEKSNGCDVICDFADVSKIVDAYGKYNNEGVLRKRWEV